MENGKNNGRNFASFTGTIKDINKKRIDHQPGSRRIELLARGKCNQISERTRNELRENAKTLPPEAVANAYINRNERLEEAEAIFLECITANPHNFQAQWGMGLLFCRRNNLPKAFEHFTAALSITEIKRRRNQYDMWLQTGFKAGKSNEQMYDAMEQLLLKEPNNQHILDLASELRVRFPKFARLCIPDIMIKLRSLNMQAGASAAERIGWEEHRPEQAHG